MSPEFIFANNARTFLALPVAVGDSVITVADASGLPVIPPGNLLPISLTSGVSNTGVYEICYASAIAGNSISVMRAQEGTTALPWNIGDIAFCGPTAMSVMPIGKPYFVPIGSTIQIATSKYSSMLYPDFVVCDGVTTRSVADGVDATLLAQFQKIGAQIGTVNIAGVDLAFSANSIAYGAGVFCAVGGGSASLSSTDGAIWKANDMPMSDVWVSVVWNGSAFFALGQNGHVLKSVDGMAWTSVITLPLQFGAAGAAWMAMIWTGTTFCAVTNNGASAISSDGVNWNSTGSWAGGDSQTAYVAWNGTIFCVSSTASATPFTATSSNGLVWTTTTAPAATGPIASNGVEFCIVTGSDGSAYAYTSKDGSTWTQNSLSLSNYIPSSVIWTGSEYVMTSTYGGSLSSANGYLLSDNATSPDGITWTPALGPAMRCTALGNGVFVGVYYTWDNSTDTQSWSFTSSNALQWAAVPLAGPDAIGDWTCAANNGTFFIALNSGTNQYAKSYDGITWTRSNTLPVSANWSAITWSGSAFCAVATGSAISIASTDGATWTQGALPSSTTWSAIAGNSTVFVAVASGGTISAYSADGVSWTLGGALGTAGRWGSIAEMGGTFVATTTSTVVTAIIPEYSTDGGVTWAATSGSAGAVACSVSASSTAFMIVENNNSSTKSVYTGNTSGTFSASSASIPSGAWDLIAFNGTEFVIAATASAIGYVTADGSVFDEIALGGNGPWGCIAANSSGVSIVISTAGNATGLVNANGTVFLSPNLAPTDSRLLVAMRVI
jgi:hypothetical protein